MTGSVDQFGNVQPIGGANEKIEGFFSYCKVSGLTGEQGVMIPSSNEHNLMLSHEVIDAVKKGKFHIWSVSTIDEGIEILSGVKAGTPDADGEYEPDTIHGKVKSSLENWIIRAYKHKKKMNDLIDPKEKKGSKKKSGQKSEAKKDAMEENE